MKQKDMIKKPTHYQLDGLPVEAKDVIKSVTKSYTGVSAYHIGNVLKYLFRAKKKDFYNDILKAREYLDYLIAEIENDKKRK